MGEVPKFRRESEMVRAAMRHAQEAGARAEHAIQAAHLSEERLEACRAVALDQATSCVTKSRLSHERSHVSLLQLPPEDRLAHYVDELIEAREQKNERAIRGRKVLIVNVLDRLRDDHEKSALAPELIERIQTEKARAELDTEIRERHRDFLKSHSTM